MAASSGDSSRFRAPIGTADVLPPESAQWVALVGAFAERARRFGFDPVITPIFEHLEVFQRAGESTDVVRKEMYDFEDKGGGSEVARWYHRDQLGSVRMLTDNTGAAVCHIHLWALRRGRWPNWNPDHTLRVRR